MDIETKLYINSYAETLSRNFKNALQEFEEMAIQFELGRMEATDKFEELKKELNTSVFEWKQMYSQLKQFDPAKAEAFKARLVDLQELLALGKAKTKEFFYEQLNKILHALLSLETEIKSHSQLNYYVDEFKTEVEIFKLKLEILKLKFELKKFDVKDLFRKEMKNARKEIDKVFSKAEDKWDDAKSRISDLSNEIEISVKHLKKVVKALHM